MTSFTYIGKHLCSAILHPIPTLHIPIELSELFLTKTFIFTDGACRYGMCTNSEEEN